MSSWSTSLLRREVWRGGQWDLWDAQGLFIIKLHGKVRDADFENWKKQIGQGEFRHAVTSPIVTHDVTSWTDLATYILHHSSGRRLNANQGGVNPFALSGGVCKQEEEPATILNMLTYNTRAVRTHARCTTKYITIG